MVPSSLLRASPATIAWFAISRRSASERSCSHSTGCCDNLAFTVYDKNFEVDPAPNGSGGDRPLSWPGYDKNDRRPRSGKYDITLALNDGGGGSPQTATQSKSIWIQTLDVSLKSVTRWVNQAKLPGTPVAITWDVAGAIDVNNPGYDHVRLRLLDMAGKEVGHRSFPANQAKTFNWDGKFDDNSLVQPGSYQLEVAVLKGGSSLGSAKLPTTFYKVGFHLVGGGTPATALLFVNDDDDFNGIVDGTEPTHAHEDDLVEVDLDVLPKDMMGTFKLTSDGSFDLWPAADKIMAKVMLPANWVNGSAPAKLFAEGTAAAMSSLKGDFTTQDGTVLDQAKLPIDVVDFNVSVDTNGNFLPDDSPYIAVGIGLWDYAFDANNNDALFVAQDEQHNFVGRDSTRFYARIKDPAANGDANTIETIAPARLAWYTVGGDRITDVDHPANAGLTLTETDKNTALFASLGLMLVTDDDDVNQATPTGQGGSASYNTADHRTRRMDFIDGMMVFSYQSALASAPRHVLFVPYFARNPVYQKTVILHFVNFKDAAHAVDPTPKSRIDDIFAATRHRYAVMGIQSHAAYDPNKDILDVTAVNAQASTSPTFRRRHESSATPFWSA